MHEGSEDRMGALRKLLDEENPSSAHHVTTEDGIRREEERSKIALPKSVEEMIRHATRTIFGDRQEAVFREALSDDRNCHAQIAGIMKGGGRCFNCENCYDLGLCSQFSEAYSEQESEGCVGVEEEKKVAPPETEIQPVFN